MSKPVSIWLSEEELQEIEQQRKKERRTRSNFIKNKIFPYGCRIVTE